MLFFHRTPENTFFLAKTQENDLTTLLFFFFNFLLDFSHILWSSRYSLIVKARLLKGHQIKKTNKITFSIANGLGTVARRRFAGGVGLVGTWGIGRGRIRHRSFVPVLISVQLTKHFISLALAHAPKLHRWTKNFKSWQRKKLSVRGKILSTYRRRRQSCLINGGSQSKGSISKNYRRWLGHAESSRESKAMFKSRLIRRN